MIRNIELTNWMNISSCNLFFIEGINIIQGAVGEGKSSIFAAIAYTLSDYKRGDSWKDYIKTGEKFFEIRLQYQFGNDDTNIMDIYYKGESFKGSVYRELTYQGETKKGEEVSQFLNTKLDQQMLNAVIFNLQGGQQLSQMTPSERRDIFKKIFNSDFSNVVAQIKSDKEVIQKDIELKSMQLNLLKTKEYQVFRIIPVDPMEMILLQSELEKAHSIETLKLRVQQYNDKKNHLALLESLLNKHISSQLGQKEDLSKYEKEKVNIESTIKDTQGLQEKNNIELSGLTGELLELQKIKSSLMNKEQLDSWLLQIKEKTSAIVLERSAIQVNTQYLDTYKLGTCPKCGQECEPNHAMEYEILVKEATDRKTGLEKSIEQLNSKISEYQGSITNSDKDISNKEREIADIQHRISLNNQRLSTSETLIFRIDTIDIVRCMSNISITERECIVVQQEIITEQEWLNSNTPPDIPEQGRDIPELQKAIEDIQSRIQGNINREQMNENVKKEKEKDAETILVNNDEINELLKQKERLDKVSAIYSTEFPNFINMRACKILEAYMNDFFNTVKNNFQVALQMDKKGVSFYYKSNNEPEWRNLRMASGFETCLSTLGFKVSCARSFGATEIFLDEIDQNSDYKSTEALFETVANVGGFKQMFIITHKTTVVDILLDSGRASGYTVKKGEFTSL